MDAVRLIDLVHLGWLAVMVMGFVVVAYGMAMHGKR